MPHQNAMNNTFQYHDLTDPSRQIRVLRIIPGDSNAVQCSLEQVELSEGHHTCLSYRWGDEDAIHEILLNGLRSRVRPNLHDFLRTARSLGVKEPLWIDAISINQDDIVEKNAQVAMMGQIYQLATRTIIWLGLPLASLDALYELRSWVTYEAKQQDCYGDDQYEKESLNDDDFVERPEKHTDLNEEIDTDGFEGQDPVECEYEDDEYDSVLFTDEIKQMLGRLVGLVPLRYIMSSIPRTPETELILNGTGSVDLIWRDNAAAEWVVKDQVWIDSCVELLDDYRDLIESIRNLHAELGWIASNRYWARAWITQEIILSKTADILTTNGTLKVHDIMAILPFFYNFEHFEQKAEKARAIPGLEGLFSKISSSWNFDGWERRRINMLSIRLGDFCKDQTSLRIFRALMMTAQSGCSDVRDRVFSICSLFPNEQKVRVDYTMSREELFLEVIATCVRDKTLASDTKSDGYCAKGSEIFNTSRQLQHALDLVPPDTNSIACQEDVLRQFAVVNVVTEMVQWANPEACDAEYSTEARDLDRIRLVGLYTVTQIGASRHLVLEFLFEPGPIGKTIELFPQSQFAKQPRAWIIEKGSFTCYMGKKHSYHWPGAGCTCHAVHTVDVAEGGAKQCHS